MSEHQHLDALSFLNGEIGFINFVREHKDIGYGRMIQIIQAEWRALLEKEGLYSPEATLDWFPKYLELEEKLRGNDGT